MIYTPCDVFLHKQLPFWGRGDCICVKIVSGINFLIVVNSSTCHRVNLTSLVSTQLPWCCCWNRRRCWRRSARTSQYCSDQVHWKDRRYHFRRRQNLTSEYNTARRSGLAMALLTAVWEATASYVYHDSHCDVQPWARAAHPSCSA